MNTPFNYERAYRIDGKVALVTGSAHGLGAEIAASLAQGGAAVLVTDRLEADGKATAARLVALGAAADFFCLDVTIESQWEAAINFVVKRFGGLDILVNNAGIEKMQFLAETPVESFRQVVDTNLIGSFLGCKHAVRAMRPGGSSGRGGAIVNLSSAAGITGATAFASYNASKGGVRLLTKSVGIECGQLGYGIRCNSIHPGVVRTEMGKHFLQQYVDLGLAPDLATIETGFLAAHPIGRFGTPQDVASAVRFLASEAASWITGAELCVDGGYTAI